MKKISLSKGFETQVDDADYEWLSQWKWHVVLGNGDRPYASRNRYGETKITMHRLILNAPKGAEVDHIDGDSLNNCRSNLRFVSRSENAINRRGPNSDNTSGFIGVTLHKSSNLWMAYLTARNKRILVGYFKSKEVAAKARDAAALEIHGQFATLNFPTCQSPGSCIALRF